MADLPRMTIRLLLVFTCCRAALAQPPVEKDRLNSRFIDAAWKHDRKRMIELLDQGADINAKGINGAFALHLAIGEGSSDADLVKLLLDRGADVNEKDDFGDTPLVTAIHFGSRNSAAVPGIV